MKRYMWLLLVLLASAARAHEPSRSLLTLEIDGSALRGQWDVALRDLEDAVGLDADADSAVSWGEVRARDTDVVAYALQRLALTTDSRPCELGGRLAGIETHGGAAFAALELTGHCAAAPRTLRVEYNLLFDIDAAHRGIVTIDGPAGLAATVLTAEQRTQTFDLAAVAASQTVRRFIAEGVSHIWQGYDHLAFVMLLLLPIALGAARGAAAPGWRTAVLEVLRVVTAFTVAHSATLTLAAFGVVTLPTRAVEVVIAASVLLAAVCNLVPRAPRLGCKLAFCFGLVHGFGFANALGDLATGAPLLGALAGFNVGVELGQLAVVAALLPLLLLIRRAALWPRAVSAAASLACAALAVGWVVERWA